MSNSQRRLKRTITLLGSTSVGKSTLCSRFVYNRASTDYEPTIRNQFQHKITLNSVEYDLQIQDTAGLERYPTISEGYINSDGFILVYSTTDNQSFQIIQDIFISLSNELNKTIPLVLVGNKSDLIEKRKVSSADGEALAKEWGAAFFETSALDGKNVTDSFIALLNLIDPIQKMGQSGNGVKKMDKSSGAHIHSQGLTTGPSAKSSCVVS
ncbi:GTP-binding Rheb [Brachionus plicatilis]|uniref:GTP-binding Rheb n=1 Tax=Brachionus plicatilis TaxID=10195 RepID=A0A3M7QU94_BRAPC|nr:GTP-binding Rheb [Brachionus plicatilis]